MASVGQKMNGLFLLFLVSLGSAPGHAFSVVQPRTSLNACSTSVVRKLPSSRLSSAPSESSSDQSEESQVTSFDDAGRSLTNEEDTKRMNEMGDFDSNPESKDDSIERMRAAIRDRAKDLGVEKSKVTQQYIEDASKRAAQTQGDGRPSGLDLSQISTRADKKSDWDEDLPAMLYDPTDELTEEERAEVDSVGQLPFWEQAAEELKNAKWPDLGSALREVGLMIVVVAFTAGLIIGWDKLLRNVYTDLGFIPSNDDIPGQLEGLSLPEGFTNNMNEEDLARLTDELNSASVEGTVAQPIIPTPSEDSLDQ